MARITTTIKIMGESILIQVEVDGKTYLADADGILTEKSTATYSGRDWWSFNLTTKKIGITTLLMVKN